MSIVTTILRKTEAWHHQAEAFDFAYDRDASLLGMEMGTGKSKIAVDLVANWSARQVLILCPKSVLGVWRREFERHWPDGAGPHRVLVLDKGTGKVKASQLDAALNLPHGCLIVVTNYEAAWREPLGTKLLNAKFDAAICDESHRIKSPGGKSSRWCQKLGRVVSRRLGLTGTPMPHSPLDLYGQFRFLAPHVFGTSFARFRARYAITNPQFPSQVRQWINEEDLQQRLNDNSYICKADDVLDLPEVMHERRTCELSSKARKIYTELEKDFVAEVDAGTITVANALTKLLRLQQITSGYVGGRNEYDEQFIQVLGNEKQTLLADLLADIDQPAVVFCRFQRDLDAIEQTAAKLHRNYGELSGRRRDLTSHAEMPEGIDVMGVQIQAGGVGIDLTRSHYGIYYSIGFSLGDYLQSVARLHRPGQEHPVRFYHLVTENTVDAAVYSALDRRLDVVETILSAIKSKGKLYEYRNCEHRPPRPAKSLGN